MKTLKDIDRKLEHFNDEVADNVKASLPSFRRVFKDALGMSVKNKGEDAIDLYQVGLKLKLSEPNISLEDAEFKLLKDAVNTNPQGLLAHFHAQVMLFLKQVESDK